MILGHYGFAMGVKRLTPSTSLATLTFAAQLLDELWPLFLLVGAERMRIVPGLLAASDIDFQSYPWSHSLLMASVWGALVGLIHYAFRRQGRAAWVLAVAVVSHWVLDLPMHRPDLPLWPGVSPLVGGGAWRSVPLTLLLDAGTFAVGLVLYLRRTRARGWQGHVALWSMVAMLLALYGSALFGPAALPGSERSMAWATLALWLFIPWSAWADRQREWLQDSPVLASPSV